MRNAARVMALLALFLYGPGILLPALHVEKLGRIRDSNILDGSVTLLRDGELLLGLVVGLSAVILPPVKLTLLLWLGAAPPSGRAHSGRWVRVLEFIGRFGCLEVFLTAVFIAIVRLNALVSFQALPGLYFFAVSAVLGLAASAALGACSYEKENPRELQSN